MTKITEWVFSLRYSETDQRWTCLGVYSWDWSAKRVFGYGTTPVTAMMDAEAKARMAR